MSNTAPVLNVLQNFTFAAKTDYAAKGSPWSVTSGDLNGDGKIDLITANSGGSASLLLGNGDGSFVVQTAFAISDAPTSATLVDFNRDGNLDLITASYSSNCVWVRLGNGAGILSAGTRFDVGSAPNSVTSADLNGDGQLDLITSNLNGWSVSVLLSNGAGGFARTDFPMGGKVYSVSCTDVNGDGKLDLIASFGTRNQSGWIAKVIVLPGNGDGTFAAQTAFDVGYDPYVTCADFNGDGNIDLITANSSSSDGSVSVLLSDGAGGYVRTDIPLRVTVGRVTSADLNGDGKLDLIIAEGYSDSNHEQSAQNIFLLRGNGDGTFQTMEKIFVGTYLKSVISADLNGDGKLDLITANSNSNNNVSVLLNTTASTFIEDGAALILSVTASVVDAGLVAAGNYSGASLTLARQGGANAQDVFSGSGSGNLTLVHGGDVTLSGTVIGTATNSNGTLVISFNASATQARVDAALQAIAYSNSSHTPPASVTLDWSFSDGDLGGALLGTGSSRVNITAVNDVPVITSNGGGAAATLSVAENTMTVTTVIATDADADARTYSITGGADAAKFTLNTSTGKLFFSDAPNFEAPASTTSSNSYVVQVKASDPSGGNTTQTLTVNVTDVDESGGGGGGGVSTTATAAAPMRIRGSSGIDTVDFGAKCSGYTLALKSPDWTVTSTAGSVVTLSSIERLSFADTTVALDINGNAGQVYRLYQAAFNRTPDQGGLGDWIYGMDNGMSLQQVSAGFVNSAEFTSVYGATPTNAEVVTRLYQNALHRAPEQAGFDHWLNQLQSGAQSRAQVLAGFSESTENQLLVIGVIQNGIEYTPHAA